MSATVSLSGRAEWLGEKHLQRLLAVLKEGGEEARVAGGAIRNTLLGQPVADIDIAATTLPEETIRRAQAAGLTGITHLFNAMPPLMGREPGPVGAALDDKALWCGLIVDLHHVSAVSLRVALAARGPERMMLVTDAMPSVGSDAGSFELLGEHIKLVDGALVNDAGTLAGSNLDMASGVRNTVRHLGVPAEDALRMASLNPATFLRLDNELGRIAPGYRADLVLLDADFNVQATWISGARQDEVKS